MPHLETLISAQRIGDRVGELAEQITCDYQNSRLIVVGVLNGAFIFLADLVRRLQVPTSIDFLRVSSYGAATTSSGVVQIRKDLDLAIADMDVLLVEDIVDTGLTANYLVSHLRMAQPNSLRVCTLLDKKHRREVEFEADYVGFEIGDEFVVGYGMDFNERYRELPSICILRNGD